MIAEPSVADRHPGTASYIQSTQDAQAESAIALALTPVGLFINDFK